MYLNLEVHGLKQVWFNCRKPKAPEIYKLNIIMCFQHLTGKKHIFSNSHYSNLVEGSFYMVVVAKVTTSFISMCSAYVYHFIS